MVADLVRVRLVTDTGEFDDTFTADTVPTLTQAERLIDQGTNAIYTQIPGSIVEEWAPAAQHLAALYTAILIEASFYREQLTDDQVSLYQRLLTDGVVGLMTTVQRANETASRIIDSVRQRSVMTQDPLVTQYFDLLDQIPPQWVLDKLAGL